MKCFNCCKCREADVIVGHAPPPVMNGNGEIHAAEALEAKEKLETDDSSLYYISAESEEEEDDEELELEQDDLDDGAFFFDAVDTSAAAAATDNALQSLGKRRHNTEEDELLLAPSVSSSGKRMRAVARSSEEWGFPGFLTPHQLEAYQEFRSEVKRRGGVYEEMVYCYKDIEPESYALCRFLRWANFHIEKVFKYMDSKKEQWNEAKSHQFYPDANVGGPLSVFLTQFPSVYTGYGKEGFPVCYIHTSSLSVEGIDCVTDVERLPNFIWYTMLHDVKRIYVEAMSRQPTLKRLEQITVMNLDGLSPKFLTPRTYAVSQQADAVAQIFPEMLYKLIIINAPRFFNYVWNSFKLLLDPNTTKRIELYSSPEKGLERLRELIDETQLPCDYGGLAMSTSEAILREGRTGPVPLQQIVELLKIRRQGKFEFALQQEEVISFEIYTRSKSCTEFTLLNERDEVVKQITVEPAEEVPYCVQFVDSVRGPGQFTVAGRHAAGGVTSSTEYFLVVGEVFRAQERASRNGRVSVLCEPDGESQLASYSR